MFQNNKQPYKTAKCKISFSNILYYTNIFKPHRFLIRHVAQIIITVSKESQLVGVVCVYIQCNSQNT